jgi:hypothetical protein
MPDRARTSEETHRTAGLLRFYHLPAAAGKPGPALDIFYLHTYMSRHRILVSKAITQTLGHALKIFYYDRLMA